jgi:NAD(P)H-hydrate epimerase
MFAFTGESAWENEINLPPMVNAIGVGPGLGQDSRTASNLLSLLAEKSNIPKVLDADALNILATTGENKFRYMQNAILTPHTKEFRRLFGETENMEDMETMATAIAGKHHVVIILKGAHTRICCPDGTIYYNTTGNPGMAKGGSGDVLTGILTGLLAQGYARKEAALTGVFLHGLAGDLAAEMYGEHSIVGSDIIEKIGPSFLKLQANEH